MRFESDSVIMWFERIGHEKIKMELKPHLHQENKLQKYVPMCYILSLSMEQLISVINVPFYKTPERIKSGVTDISIQQSTYGILKQWVKIRFRLCR